MPFASYRPPSEVLTLPNGDSVSLRGLGVNDLIPLVRNHYDALSGLFDKYVGEQVASTVLDDSQDMKDVLLGLLDVAPKLIFDAIGASADEPDAAASVGTLPVGTLIEATEKVVRLTLEAEGGLGKLTETVKKLAQTVNPPAQDRLI